MTMTATMPEQPPAAALIMAAGRGERLGAEQPKCFLPLAGIPLYAHSLRAFAAVPEVRRCVVVAPAGWEAQVLRETADFDLPWPVTVVAGGAERDASVRAGLAA